MQPHATLNVLGWLGTSICNTSVLRKKAGCHA